MEDEEREHLTELLRLYTRRLRPLEKQIAAYGMRTPPDIIIEIEDIKNNITQIKKQLETINSGKVPLLGTIAAGIPLPNPEETHGNILQSIIIPSNKLPFDKLRGVYALNVRGDSMVDAFIDNGDIILLKYQETAENGQMVAVYIKDENSVTLKRFYREIDDLFLGKGFRKRDRKFTKRMDSYIRLQPANIDGVT